MSVPLKLSWRTRHVYLCLECACWAALGDPGAGCRACLLGGESEAEGGCGGRRLMSPCVFLSVLEGLLP